MGDFRVLKPQCETASRNDGTFFQGMPQWETLATMGDITADPLGPAVLNTE